MFGKKKIPALSLEEVQEKEAIARSLNVEKNLEKLEKENLHAVKTDHRFATVMIAGIAIAALVGMSFGDLQQVLSGHIDGGILTTLAVTFLLVLGSNKVILTGARNIRRAQARNEPRPVFDIVIMAASMATESLSVGLMLYVLEQPKDFVHWLILIARSALIPVFVAYLEIQIAYPIDSKQQSLEVEKLVGVGLLRKTSRVAISDNIPLSELAELYVQAAGLTGSDAARINGIATIAAKYENNITLYDAKGQQLSRVIVDEDASVRTLTRSNPTIKKIERNTRLATLLPQRARGAKQEPVQTIPAQDDRIHTIIEHLNAGEKLTVRTVMKLISGLSQGQAASDLKVAQERYQNQKTKAGPANTGYPVPFLEAEA